MSGAGDVQAQLKALQRDYAARLPSRAAEISVRFEALRLRWCPKEATESLDAVGDALHALISAAVAVRVD